MPEWWTWFDTLIWTVAILANGFVLWHMATKKR